LINAREHSPLEVRKETVDQRGQNQVRSPDVSEFQNKDLPISGA
jgi:hypothetical protein